MSVLDEVKDLAGAVARRRALRLWDVEVGGQPGRTVVRVLIDSDGGIDLDTVAEVSEEISRGLDLRDPISGRYTLEVSSPGLERNLRSWEHFRASVGERVVIKTVERIVADSHRVEGTITDAGESSVTVDVEGRPIEMSLDQIRSARTVFEWS